MQKELMKNSSKTVSRLIVPSIFFSLFFAIMAYSSVLGGVKLAAVATVISILTNLYYRNTIAARMLGVVFFLSSCYFALALADDFFDGETDASNYFDLALIIVSAVMSVLMISWHKASNKPTEQIA